MSDDGEHIIKFRRDDDGIVARRRKRDNSKSDLCKHWEVELCDQRRMVHCDSCDAWLEGYDWIQHVANKQLWTFSCLDDARRILAELHAEIESLRKEEANCKARIRRAKKKSAG
jgi:hypothetical protein